MAVSAHASLPEDGSGIAQRFAARAVPDQWRMVDQYTAKIAPSCCEQLAQTFELLTPEFTTGRPERLRRRR